MEEKVFNLLEKMYVEMKDGFAKVNCRIDSLENRIDSLENRIIKVELNQEHANEKIDEVFEALSAHVEIDEKQHQDIMEELKGEINVVELALKRVAKA